MSFGANPARNRELFACGGLAFGGAEASERTADDFTRREFAPIAIRKERPELVGYALDRRTRAEAGETEREVVRKALRDRVGRGDFPEPIELGRGGHG